MTMTGPFGRMGSGDCLLLPTVDRKSAVETILSRSHFLVRHRTIFSRQAVLHELNQFPFLESSFQSAQAWRTESDSREFLCWFDFDWFLMSASKNPARPKVFLSWHAQFNRKFDIFRLQIGFLSCLGTQTDFLLSAAWTKSRKSVCVPRLDFPGLVDFWVRLRGGWGWNSWAKPASVAYCATAHGFRYANEETWH